MPVVTRTGEVIFSQQWGLRWLEKRCECISEYAKYLNSGDLASCVMAARESGANEADATRQFYIDNMRRYAANNPKAKTKVDNTLALYS